MRVMCFSLGQSVSKGMDSNGPVWAAKVGDVAIVTRGQKILIPSPSSCPKISQQGTFRNIPAFGGSVFSIPPNHTAVFLFCQWKVNSGVLGTSDSPGFSQGEAACV